MWKTRLIGCLCAVWLCFIAGCNGLPTHPNKPHEPWDAARSAVQLRLASELLSVGSVADAEARLAESRSLAREESDASRLIAARIEVAKGNFTRACQIADEISLGSAERAEAEYLAGVALLAQQQWPEAARRFHVAAGLRPGEREYWLSEIQAQLQAGDVEGAHVLIADRAEANGWSASLNVALAECEELRGNCAAAAEAWARTCDSAVVRAETRARAGMAMYRASRWPEAAELLREEIEAQEESAAPMSLRLALVDCLIETREIAAARQYLEPLAQSAPRDARVACRLAQILTLEDRASDALIVLDAALAGTPRDVRLLELGAAVAHYVGRSNLAAEYSRRISIEDTRDAINPVVARITASGSATEPRH
ncbi:MAG: hypothetical protein JNG88_11475 [Phycisphaerales bacterium]|nr:hypothetical protein [Phycisphaerales bacterium]